ncbi:MAG TPA: hypothetical protein VK147_00140 [Candidatus Didemnitutus sp.]|nr:hypothetical protein [Candidatus Didemnitutus sp.]
MYRSGTKLSGTAAIRYCTLTLLLLLSHSSVFATDPWFGFAVRGGASLSTPSFSALPGYPSAGIDYDPSIGFQIGGDLLAGVELAPRWWMIVGAGVTSLNTTAQSRETTTLSIDDEAFTAVVLHNIEFTYLVADLRLAVMYAFPTIRLQLGVFGRVPLIASVEQSQEIVEPPGIEFPEGSVRIDGEGELPGLARLVQYLEVGISSTGDDVGAFHISPFIMAEIPLSSVSTDVAWSISTLSLGVRLQTRSNKSAGIQRDTLLTRDTVIVSKKIGTSGIQLLAVDIDSSMLVTDTLVRTTVILHEHYQRTYIEPTPVVVASVRPLFVDEAGREHTSWTIKRVRHRNVVRIPVVGMMHYPLDLLETDTVSVVLPEVSDTTSHSVIARTMAAQNARALRRACASASRLTVTFNKLDDAELSTRTNVVTTWLRNAGFGGTIATKRSVEHDSSVIEIHGYEQKMPYQSQSWMTMLMSPVRIHFYPTVDADEDIASWEIVITDEESRADTIGGSGAPSQYVAWKVPDSFVAGESKEIRCTYRLIVRTTSGYTTSTDPGTISFVMGNTNETPVEMWTYRVGGKHDATSQDDIQLPSPLPRLVRSSK